MGMGVLHGCVYGSSRLMSAIFLVLFFHIRYSGRVSLSQANPVFANMVDFTGYLALRILSRPSQARIIGRPSYPSSSSMNSGDPNSGSFACTASDLTIEFLTQFQLLTSCLQCPVRLYQTNDSSNIAKAATQTILM